MFALSTLLYYMTHAYKYSSWLNYLIKQTFLEIIHSKLYAVYTQFFTRTFFITKRKETALV